MSQLERMALRDFLLIALLATACFYAGQLFAPQPAWAESPQLTENSIGGSVTATTTAASYVIPGSRAGMIMFKGDAGNGDVIYVKMADQGGQTTASAFNFDFIVGADEAFTASQHRTRGFSYIAASGSQTLEHFAAWR